MKPLALITALIVLFSGCSDTTAPAPPTMAGSWTGTFESSTITFTAAENDQTISGNGYISNGGQASSLTISGTHAHPHVALTVQLAGFQDIAFSGEFVSDTEVSGRLNGSGFNDYQFVLTKQ